MAALMTGVRLSLVIREEVFCWPPVQLDSSQRRLFLAYQFC